MSEIQTIIVQVPGLQGPPGSSGSFTSVSVGDTITLPPGDPALVEDVGASGSIVLQFSIPAGEAGASGFSSTITIGDTETLAPGSDATVINEGTPSTAVLKFGIPRGADGTDGEDGASGNTPAFAIGSVTTLDPDQAASASITGSVSNPQLNLSIPRGFDGNTVLTTSGVPDNSFGENGDYAYDPINLVMYGPKAANVWPAGTEIIPTWLRTGAKLSNYVNCK